MKNERKEELKDEMKNRISLALKDPILQQGFEIICKENAELEKKIKSLEGNSSLHEGILWNDIHNQDKKIAELEHKLEQTEKELADYQFNYPTIKELERENAELKEKLNFSTQYYQGEKAKEQLTTAKEIIKSLLTCCRNYPQENAEKMYRAEQFLKEVEK